MQKLVFKLTNDELKYFHTKGAKAVLRNWRSQLKVKDKILIKLSHSIFFFRRIMRFVAAWMIVMLIIFMASWFLNPGNSMLPVYIALLFCIMAFMVRYLNFYEFNMLMREISSTTGELSIYFDPDHVALEGQQHYQKNAWSFFDSIFTDKKFIYLVSYPNPTIVIPKRIFSTELEATEFFKSITDLWHAKRNAICHG